MVDDFGTVWAKKFQVSSSKFQVMGLGAKGKKLQDREKIFFMGEIGGRRGKYVEIVAIRRK
jgi:hypothetical protein